MVATSCSCVLVVWVCNSVQPRFKKNQSNLECIIIFSSLVNVLTLLKTKFVTVLVSVCIFSATSATHFKKYNEPTLLDISRKATQEMMCMVCLKIQPVGPFCQTPSCNRLSMAKYYCNICKFFDDER